MISCPGMAFGRSRLWRTRLHSAPGLSVCRLGARLPRTLGGNFAGLKFSLAPAAAPSALSFDIAKSSTWGSAQFECTYTCDIYGFAADGSSTVIGTWSLADAVDNLSSDGIHVSIDLNMGDASYDSYGLILTPINRGASQGVWPRRSPIFRFPEKWFLNRLRRLWD